MSTVLTFFKEHPSSDDPLHKALAGIPVLQAQLPEIRQKMLGCCEAEPAKDGSVKLVVVDVDGWDRLSKEQETIKFKLAMLDKLVSDMDKIFADAEKQGFQIFSKTPAGIARAEAHWRDQHQKREVDDFGHPVPRAGNPELVALLQRADVAMIAAGLCGV